jgi:hypothetical protein
MSLQRGFFEQEPLGAKILCVIARFTTGLIAKIQPEATSLIPKFTPSAHENSPDFMAELLLAICTYIPASRQKN